VIAYESNNDFKAKNHTDFSAKSEGWGQEKEVTVGSKGE
jgi:hypothetical protein